MSASLIATARDFRLKLTILESLVLRIWSLQGLLRRCRTTTWVIGLFGLAQNTHFALPQCSDQVKIIPKKICESVA